MRKILLLLLFLLSTVILRGDPDYMMNVWVRHDGTNVSYSLGRGHASLRDIQTVARQVAAVSNTQTVRIITDNVTPVSDLLRVCTMISHSGLTNVLVAVCNSTNAADNTSSVMALSGAHITFKYIKDSAMLDMNSARKKPGANIVTNKTETESSPPNPLIWPMEQSR